MTCTDLIDYLQQFPPTTRVVLSDLHHEQPDVDFIELEYLDYDNGVRP